MKIKIFQSCELDGKEHKVVRRGKEGTHEVPASLLFNEHLQQLVVDGKIKFVELGSVEVKEAVKALGEEKFAELEKTDLFHKFSSVLEDFVDGIEEADDLDKPASQNADAINVEAALKFEEEQKLAEEEAKKLEEAEALKLKEADEAKKLEEQKKQQGKKK